MRKKAARVAIFLMLGAMVNISVAWWCAYRLPAYYGVFHPSKVESEEKFVGYTMSESQFPRWCFRWRERTATRVYHWHVEYEDTQVPYATLEESLKHVPHWTTVGHTDPLPYDEDALSHLPPDYIVEEARGWPFLSFSCRLVMKFDQQTNFPYPVSVSGGIAIARENWPSPAMGAGWIYDDKLPDVGPLPYRPIWPGLLVNSVFYAIPLFVLFHIPLWIRRSNRKSRNRCPDCAYPVGSSAICTECGYQLVKSNT